MFQNIDLEVFDDVYAPHYSLPSPILFLNQVMAAALWSDQGVIDRTIK